MFEEGFMSRRHYRHNGFNGKRPAKNNGNRINQEEDKPKILFVKEGGDEAIRDPDPENPPPKGRGMYTVKLV